MPVMPVTILMSCMVSPLIMLVCNSEHRQTRPGMAGMQNRAILQVDSDFEYHSMIKLLLSCEEEQK